MTAPLVKTAKTFHLEGVSTPSSTDAPRAQILAQDDVAIVVIGRNEGARLGECIASLDGSSRNIIYVDSGSTDDSVARAKEAGLAVIELDETRPFTAARARNAGFADLMKNCAPRFVQFVDGDCAIAPGWIDTGAAFLKETPRAAAAFGAIAERRPEASLFNRMIDREWRGSPGEALYCGGIAMMRAQSFDAAGGFREDLIAGEEPELCVRLRQTGATIHRLDAPMASHDADMKSLRQWLTRARRAGHAFAEVSTLHRRSPVGIWRRETIRPIAWTGFAAAALLLGAFSHALFFLALLIIPAQIARMAQREQPTTRDSYTHAGMMMLQKPWEAAGVIQFWVRRLLGGRSELIEYRAQGGDRGQ